MRNLAINNFNPLNSKADSGSLVEKTQVLFATVWFFEEYEKIGEIMEDLEDKYFRFILALHSNII